MNNFERLKEEVVEVLKAHNIYYGWASSEYYEEDDEDNSTIVYFSSHNNSIVLSSEVLSELMNTASKYNMKMSIDQNGYKDTKSLYMQMRFTEADVNLDKTIALSVKELNDIASTLVMLCNDKAPKDFCLKDFLENCTGVNLPKEVLEHLSNITGK